jgi:proteasome component ECM29
LSAESDETKDVSVPHEKILDCVTSCIHVAHINDILEQQKDLMHVFITSLSPSSPWTGILLAFFSLSFGLVTKSVVPSFIKLSWAVKTTAFSSIKELCSRLNKALDDSQGTSLHANLTSLVQEVIRVHFIYHIYLCDSSEHQFMYLPSVVSHGVT